jgi:hypothetical protein
MPKALVPVAIMSILAATPTLAAPGTSSLAQLKTVNRSRELPAHLNAINTTTCVLSESRQRQPPVLSC